MFYKKTSKYPKTTNLKVEVKDFSKGLNFNKEENLLKPDSSVNFYNFSFKKGVLTEGYGFQTLSCPNYEDDTYKEVYLNTDYFDENTKFEALWFYKMWDDEQGGRIDKLMYRLEDGRMVFSRVMTIAPMINPCMDITLAERPACTYNYKLDGYDYNLVCSEKNGVQLHDGYFPPQILENVPKISSLCEDKGKMFCTTFGEKNIIYYHTDTNILDWTTELNGVNGKIEMNDNRGKINKVIPFLGYVFAIRDYGISKITNYENKVKFDITHLSLSGNKIYENTVNICSDKMLMLTKEGISSFNGNTSEILNVGFNEFLKNVNNDNARAVFHSGKYYLACRLNFNDGKRVGCEALDTPFKNNALIIMDVNSLEYDIVRGVDISDLVSVQLNKMDKVAFVLNSLKRNTILELNSNGSFYETPLKKEWNSPLSDLGYSNKIKLIKYVSLVSIYDCTLTIFTEKESKTFKINGENTLTKLKVNLKGKQVGIKIETDSPKAYISNLKFDIDLLDYEFTK